MEELIKLLEEVKPGVDFKNEMALVEDEIITSFDIVMIVSKIQKQYDIEIPVKDIVIENFNNAESLYKLIQKLDD